MDKVRGSGPQRDVSRYPNSTYPQCSATGSYVRHANRAKATNYYLVTARQVSELAIDVIILAVSGVLNLWVDLANFLLSILDPNNTDIFVTISWNSQRIALWTQSGSDVVDNKNGFSKLLSLLESHSVYLNDVAIHVLFIRNLWVFIVNVEMFSHGPSISDIVPS